MLQDYQLLYLDNDIPINRSFYCNNGDIKSRGLEVHVLDNSQAKDCTGLSIKMIVRVPSGEMFESTAANGLVTVLNAATGIYQVLFPNNMGRGRLIAEIQLSNTVPEVIVSRKFSILGDGSLTSDGSISELPGAGILQEIIQNEAQRQADYDAILGSLDAEVATKYAELETEYATDLTDVKSQLAERATKTALEVEKARITNLATLAEGSTTGDAELIDARVGADGVTYANIGEAVREQLINFKNSLNDVATPILNYWTSGDISVPATGAWAYKIVNQAITLSPTINDLCVKLGGISDSVDVHRIYIDILDVNSNVISTGHIKTNTFTSNVAKKDGYVVFDVSQIRDSVKYIKVQAQAYAENIPTITGNIVYSDIVVYDFNTEITLKLKVYESSLSSNLKGRLNLAVGKGALKQDIGTLADGNFIQLCINQIKKNKHLIFSGKIDTFTSIRIGHGTGYYGGAYLEIDATNIKLYRHDTSAVLVKTVAHGLTITENIFVEITNSVSKYGFHATIKIVSNGVTFTQSGAFDFPWIGSNGGVFVSSSGSVLKNCKIAWSCDDFSTDIYAFGDSYFDFWNSKMADLGHANKFLFDGYGGRKSADAIASFNFCLQYGQPKYVLWCMGMNDPDVGAINANWLSAFNTVIDACGSKDIIPIFCTIPNIPTNDNTYKNNHIKASGYRYVDIAEFVGSNFSTSWYTGMLGPDNIHPADLGSYAIAENIIADLADIIFAK